MVERLELQLEGREERGDVGEILHGELHEGGSSAFKHVTLKQQQQQPIRTQNLECSYIISDEHAQGQEPRTYPMSKWLCAETDSELGQRAQTGRVS